MRRSDGTWQCAVVTSDVGGEVVVQWGASRKRIVLPSVHIRAATGHIDMGQDMVQGVDDYMHSSASCECCGTQGVELWPCSGCYRVIYCGSSCQYRDWAGHRSACDAYLRAREHKKKTKRRERDREITMLTRSPHSSRSPHRSPRASPRPSPPLPSPTRLYSAERARLYDLPDRDLERERERPELSDFVSYDKVETYGYGGARGHFNGLQGHVVGLASPASSTAHRKYYVQFYLRSGVLLSISEHHLRPAPTLPRGYALGDKIAAGSENGREGSIVGLRGTLLLVEFEGKHQGLFPVCHLFAGFL